MTNNINLFPVLFVGCCAILIVLFLIYDHKKGKRMKEENVLKEIEEEKLQYEIKRELRLGEALHQAELAGEQGIVERIKNGTYSGTLPELDGWFYKSIFDNLLIIPIAGMGYRGNLSAYEGDFKGVLVPEPKNEYDPNAIMVKCEDGRHLGYIPEHRTADVRKLIGEDFTRHRITGEIINMSDDDERIFKGIVYIAKTI